MHLRAWSCWIAIGVIAGCGGKDGGDGDGAAAADVMAGEGELRRLDETGALPFNQCRARLQEALRRVRRGPVVEHLAISGPSLCLSEQTFVDCATVAAGRFPDACGSLGTVKRPTGAPGDGKRFLAELAAFKAHYNELVARAPAAKPTLLFRERCRWSGDDSGVVYEDLKTGSTRSFGTAICDAEVTSLDAALTPTATVVASSTVKAKFKAELEKQASEIDRANADAMEQARQQARAAVVAKLEP